MFTLISIGIGVAYAYSVVATVAPQIFPQSLRTMGGAVPVYFEVAAVITALDLRRAGAGNPRSHRDRQGDPRLAGTGCQDRAPGS